MDHSFPRSSGQVPNVPNLSYIDERPREKKFVCYVLEGLQCRGGRREWVKLTTCPTEDSARMAVHGVDRGDIVQTRITPYYRVPHA